MLAWKDFCTVTQAVEIIKYLSVLVSVMILKTNLHVNYLI